MTDYPKSKISWGMGIFALGLLLLLISTPAKCQTVTSLCAPVCQFFDGSGNVLASGKIFTFQAGTTTNQATYTDSTGLTQNTNPIILNAAGMPSNINGAVGIYLTTASYKVVAQNSLGVQQWSQDNITIFNPSALLKNVSANCTSPGPATSGFLQMCNGDIINWRNIANNANIGFKNAGAAATGTGNVADVMQYGSSTLGALQSQAYLDFSTGPAQSGVVRGGNNVCLVASRNASGNGDVCAMQVNGLNITVLGGSSGVSFTGNLILTNVLEFTGNSGLPASTGTNLWFAGNFGSPILGKIYVGDGTGWELDFAKRVGSVDSTLAKMKDNGQLETQSLSVDNNVVNSAAFQRFRSTGTSCTTGTADGNCCNTNAISLPVTEPDSLYSAWCETDGSNTGSPIIQGIGNKTTTSFTISVCNVGSGVAASYGAVGCWVVHDDTGH